MAASVAGGRRGVSPLDWTTCELDGQGCREDLLAWHRAYFEWCGSAINDVSESVIKLRRSTASAVEVRTAAKRGPQRPRVQGRSPGGVEGQRPLPSESYAKRPRSIGTYYVRGK